MSETPVPSASEPVAESRSPAPRRGRRPFRRLVPILIGVAGAVLFNLFFMPHDVQLNLVLPESQRAITSLDVRLTRTSDGAQLLRTRRAKEPGARSVILETKLRDGAYRIEAWPGGTSEGALEGALTYDGQDAVDVVLAPRP